MYRVKTLFAMVLALLMLAACTVPARQPAARPAPGTVVAERQLTGLPQVTVKTRNDATLGMILVDANRMTLYRYTDDQPNVSHCYDQCAVDWRPLLASVGQPYLAGGVAGRLDISLRADGGRQITYEGVPLYRWVRDVKPGDTTGHRVGSVWFVAQPTTARKVGSAPN